MSSTLFRPDRLTNAPKYVTIFPARADRNTPKFIVSPMEADCFTNKRLTFTRIRERMSHNENLGQIMLGYIIIGILMGIINHYIMKQTKRGIR